MGTEFSVLFPQASTPTIPPVFLVHMLVHPLAVVTQNGSGTSEAPTSWRNPALQKAAPTLVSLSDEVIVVLALEVKGARDHDLRCQSISPSCRNLEITSCPGLPIA